MSPPTPDPIFSTYVNPNHALQPNRGISLSVADRVLENVSLIDMLVLRTASKFWYAAVRSLLRRKHRALLLKYVADVFALRTLMRTTRSIVCGSEALDFCLHGTNAPLLSPGDLDLYANCVHAVLLVRHFMETEGYEFTSDVDEAGTTIERSERGGAIISCTNLIHRDRCTKVQVHCVSRLSAAHQLPFFWGTLMMNCLTADGVAMAYPSLTVQAKGLISPIGHPGYKTEERIRQYRDAGFAIHGFNSNTLSDLESLPTTGAGALSFMSLSREHYHRMVIWNCPHTARQLGDEGTFRLAFARGDEVAPDWARGEPTLWIMGGPDCGGGCGRQGPGSVRWESVVVCEKHTDSG